MSGVVFIVTSGLYDDYHIEGVFLSKELATLFSKEFNSNLRNVTQARVEEYGLDDASMAGLVLKEVKGEALIRFNPEKGEAEAYFPEYARTENVALPPDHTSKVFENTVVVSTISPEHALKVAQEVAKSLYWDTSGYVSQLRKRD